ncbi:unnamed protein product, partial [Aureobasidium uvarum]
MCLVHTPYYHLCGHYGPRVVAPNGRCARAERTPGACWEPQDIGIRPLEAMCTGCERITKTAEIHQHDTSTLGPVDVGKFNQLVKLHKQTASEASTYSPITSTATLPPPTDQDSRRPSIASETSITSTAASTMSTGGRPPIYSISAWTKVEEWTKQNTKNHQIG